MGATASISSMSHRRIAHARAWLSLRDPAEELLIIGASLDAANELARGVVQTGGSVFGWHRFSLAQLAAALAAPTMAERGIVERWVTPDQELVPYRLAEAFNEQITQENTDAPAVGDSRGPVIAGQLRAPRRWERLLVEAAVIGGRERWRRRIDGLANDLRLKLAELAGEDEARAAIVAQTLEDLNAFAASSIPIDTTRLSLVVSR
jgi:hypothetical protein